MAGLRRVHVRYFWVAFLGRFNVLARIVAYVADAAKVVVHLVEQSERHVDGRLLQSLVSQCGKPTLNRHSVYIGEDVIANVGR